MKPYALILGAASDIAQALAHILAAQGYHLYLAGRSTDLLQRNAADLALRHNATAQVLYFDAKAYDSHAAFYAQLPQPPSLVVCILGYLGNQALAQTNFEETANIIDTNLTGCVSMLNIVANDFEQRQQGVIVGVSSVAGERGRQKNYVYGAAKAGFTAYLSGLRNRLSRSNVQVLTVQPGFVATKMIADLPATPPALTATPAQAAQDIWKGIVAKKDVIYTRWFWRYIMLIIKNIPEKIFKKMNI